MHKLFAPLSDVLNTANWPSHLFQPKEGGNFLDRIYVVEYFAAPTVDSLVIHVGVVFKGELELTLPGIDGMSLAFVGSKPASPPLTGPNDELEEPETEGTDEDPREGILPDTDLGPDWIVLSLTFRLDDGEWSLTLEDVTIELRFPDDILRPADGSPHAHLSLQGNVVLNDTFDVDFQGFDAVDLSRCEVGQSGVIISADGLKLDLSRTSSQAEIIAAGFDESFIGIYIGQAKVELPDGFPALAPQDLVLKNCALGSGGVTGRLEAHYSPVYDSTTKTFSGNGAGVLFGIPFGLKDIDLDFKQNTFQKSEIKGELLLPFFDEPVEVDIGISVDGDLTVGLTSTGSDGLYKLTKPNVLEIELDSIGFELKDGVFLAKLSGELTPLFGADKGLDWPSFKVEELSIDSKGHVHLKGGWLDLREQYELDFYGFKIGITKLGFGKTDDGGKWIGFSGELKLVDGFTGGASVNGLRITWYDDPRQPKFSFDGVGVEFEIPETLYFKGDVAFRELQVGTELVRRFEGDIKLDLISLDLKVDAKLIIGSTIGGPQGRYNFFAIYLGVELPNGLRLGATGLALYEMAGLVALQMKPNKAADEEWYEGWYKRQKTGATDLDSKWVNDRGSMAFGVGATIGTDGDSGFVFSTKALLVILFPGPIFLLEGKANLLTERAKIDDDPLFRALAVLDMRQGQISIGLDATYLRDWPTGRIIDIRAGADAFFHTPTDWHIYLGEREPRAKRIRATLLRLFKADAYFMIEPKWLATGIWAGFAEQWRFGPVGLSLEAWIESNVVVNWTPLHFHGDLWLHGNIDVNVFKFNLGLSVDARFAADVFEPYHVIASFEVSVRLPKPLKKKSFEITLEWGPQKVWPALLPLPLKEVAIEHFKVTTSWPLPKDGPVPLLRPKYDFVSEGLRNYDPVPPPFNEPPISTFPVVPLDSRPHISFGRAVHDDALVGVNPQPIVPEYERIGDPQKNEGPARARYALKEIELSKWDQQAQEWRTVAAAGRPLNGGERKLFGSWAPVPQLPTGTGQGAVANVKLWLWSKTPFDYTRHGGSDWDDWFIANFPNYPCVPQDIPDREVCCDFENLDRSQFLESPWRSPDHPEITLSWQHGDPQRVKILDPPVKGFTRALCFKLEGATGTVSSSSVSINLSEPAKHLKLWLVEKQKPAKICIDFRSRRRANVKLPLEEKGVIIGSTGTTLIMPVATTLGDLGGIDCSVGQPAKVGSVINITLPCAATLVELNLSRQPSPAGSTAPTIALFNSKGEQAATKTMRNPIGQPEMVRIEEADIVQIRITSTGARVFLHQLCFLCPDTTPNLAVTGFDAEGKVTGISATGGDTIELTGENLTRVSLSGRGEVCLLKICALFGPDPKEVMNRQEMAAHLQSEVARWQDEGEVLEPFCAYRLTIATAIDAYGEGELSGEHHLSQIEHAYFRTDGPPGLTKLSLPPGGATAKDADKFDSGLEDLTRYVRQTMPATIPAVGEKPVMAKPFYRAYDLGVEFNETYVDLMYRISGRDLGLYLYDSNNRSVRNAEGQLLVQSGDWGAVEELTLTEGEQHWLALSNSANGCLPVIDQDNIAHDKKLTSTIAGRVLDPDTIYEARLIPLLLREGFRNHAVGTSAQGPFGKLGRWEVHDEGDINPPSNWEVKEIVAPASKYLTQTSSIKGGNEDAHDPLKPGTMLVFGADPGLDPGHQEQPANWTDYRLSVYLKAATGGAMGVVFRYRDGNNCYRFSMDRNRSYRRLVSVVNGSHTVLKQDDFVYELQQDYLITIEAIGDALRVYQDGALIFDATDAAHPNGSIGLYCYDNAGARFNDVRVDDFRKTAPVVYRFQFTTSLFANFFHHLHSYQDETWRKALENVPDALTAMAKAVMHATSVGDGEARAYETLATTVLGPGARQNPTEVQVTRVEIDGASLAFLVQSPEPIDWLRTEIALWRTSLARTEPALPGKVKLAAVNFAANRIDIDSVVLLLREPMSLTGYRIESRLVTWPVNLNTGVVIDAQTLSDAGLPGQDWATYRTFETGGKLPAGEILEIQPKDTGPLSQAGQVGLDAGSVDFSRRIFYSVEMRLVAPNGEIVHARHFLPDDDYVSEDVKVLRKADGTGFFMVKLDVALNVVPLSLDQYRLKLTYHRNNKTRVPTSQIWSQAGNDADEIVTLDIPVQTQ